MKLIDALKKEVSTLERFELGSLRAAEKAGKVSQGSFYRTILREQIDSYKRIIKSMEGGL